MTIWVKKIAYDAKLRALSLICLSESSHKKTQILSSSLFKFILHPLTNLYIPILKSGGNMFLPSKNNFIVTIIGRLKNTDQ